MTVLPLLLDTTLPTGEYTALRRRFLPFIAWARGFEQQRLINSFGRRTDSDPLATQGAERALRPHLETESWVGWVGKEQSEA